MASSSSDENQQPTYETLLAKVLTGDLTIDFAAFRMAYTRSKDYVFPGTFLSRRDVFDFEALILKEKNYTKALKIAEKALAKNFADINAHFIAGLAFMVTGNEKALYHRTLFKKLLESIENSGSGKTLETAYVVISVQEEYALLDNQGYEVESQALIRQENHWYDLLSVINQRTKEKAEFYFQIDVLFFGDDELCDNCLIPERFLFAKGKHLMRCSKCHKVKYCSRNCQRVHWIREHRHQCQG